MHTCKVHNHTFALKRLLSNLTKGCLLLVRTILYHSAHMQSLTGDKGTHVSPPIRCSKSTEVKTKSDKSQDNQAFRMLRHCLLRGWFWWACWSRAFSQVLFHTNSSIAQRRLIIIYYSPSGNTHFKLGTFQTHQERQSQSEGFVVNGSHFWAPSLMDRQLQTPMVLRTATRICQNKAAHKVT